MIPPSDGSWCVAKNEGAVSPGGDNAAPTVVLPQVDASEVASGRRDTEERAQIGRAQHAGRLRSRVSDGSDSFSLLCAVPQMAEFSAVPLCATAVHQGAVDAALSLGAPRLPSAAASRERLAGIVGDALDIILDGDDLFDDIWTRQRPKRRRFLAAGALSQQ